MYHKAVSPSCEMSVLTTLSRKRWKNGKQIKILIVNSFLGHLNNISFCKKQMNLGPFWCLIIDLIISKLIVINPTTTKFKDVRRYRKENPTNVNAIEKTLTYPVPLGKMGKSQLLTT